MTLSICAFEPATGSLGVATTTGYFAVGVDVPWIHPGVGAVATQGLTEPGYGPTVLELLRTGRPAREALTFALNNDGHADARQVAVVGTTAGTAAHTGQSCIPYAAHAVAGGVAVVGNLLSDAEAIEVALGAYHRAKGPLASRLLAGLEAGDRAGGDLRGVRSAALIVRRSDAPRPIVDVRIDDDDDPLKSLRRLVIRSTAYDHLGRGINAMFEGRRADARLETAAAHGLLPDDEQIKFWFLRAHNRPVTLSPRWKELDQRLRPGDV